MDSSVLRQLVDERHLHWRAAGARWEIIDGPRTDKPAAWVVLTTDAAIGQLTVWVSGEAEMEWGTVRGVNVRHYDLDSVDALRTCLAALERALGFDLAPRGSAA